MNKLLSLFLFIVFNCFLNLQSADSVDIANPTTLFLKIGSAFFVSTFACTTVNSYFNLKNNRKPQTSFKQSMLNAVKEDFSFKIFLSAFIGFAGIVLYGMQGV